MKRPGVRRTLLMALLLTPVFAAAQTAKLDGTWHINGDVASNAVLSTCILATTEGKITGTCTGTDGKVMPVTGTVTETSVKWSYESVYNDGKIVLSYTGALGKDGKMTGTIYVDPYDAEGSFTATRNETSGS